ncbi:ribonuclease H-like domain-containing protein [Candidatus Nomurabacteria bacterium]|nr:ribonuclease H-like domain-containing protein [Candidatus Nomurabacteria bacterium]
MRKITFDIETSNIFSEVGSADPTLLDLSVVCIHDSETDLYSHFFQEDLNKLWPIIEKADMLIGYNSNNFDIPLLNKYYAGDLKHIKSLDLLEEIRKSLGRRIKLDDIAKGTLGEQKSADGLQALVWWKNGEKQKVVDYCIQDVKVTKKIYDYALENGYVRYPKNGKVAEIKLDTSKWEEKEGGLAPTLGF